MRSLRSLALVAAAGAAVSPLARATWSIVMIDQATGEVGIGCATCLTGLDLETLTPVMLTGIGAANAQSQLDSDGSNRRYIWDELLKGTSPTDILAGLARRDRQHQSRQYGIIDLQARKVTFTGSNCGQWAGGVGGTIGTISYVIQGNVLTGQPVIAAAEQSLRNTAGDLSEKLMAAMEGARSMGGDGRCSCDPIHPTRCGSPPHGWNPDTGKAAHIGFMVVSRIGDTDGDCNSTIGCANGSYYMNLNVAFQQADDVDPVIQLRDLFDSWRDSWRGRPDHIKSTATLAPPSVPGNGTRTSTLTITLNDWEGNPVGHGGANVTVNHSVKSARLATIGSVVDHLDGTYGVTLTAGKGQGTDEFEIVVDDGLGPVTLYPFPTLKETETLTSSSTSISAASGGTLDFDLIGPEEVPPPDYLLLCSASGTSPGIDLCDVVVPLNLDSLTIASYALRNTPNFVNTAAVLAPDGSSTAQFYVDPGDLVPLIGYDLAFAYFTHDPVTFASNAVVVAVAP